MATECSPADGRSARREGTVVRCHRSGESDDRMKAALRVGDVDAFANDMTPEGGGRLKQWFATAPQNERDHYKTAFVEQQPFFVFDESPLLVVYVRTAQRDVQVLYF